MNVNLKVRGGSSTRFISCISTFTVLILHFSYNHNSILNSPTTANRHLCCCCGGLFKIFFQISRWRELTSVNFIRQIFTVDLKMWYGKHAARSQADLSRPSALTQWASKHVLNAQVSIRSPCCRKWFDCAECHKETENHPLMQQFEMVFACKRCKKCFRKDAQEFEESDEYCPHCDNHFILDAVTPKPRLEVEGEDARVDARYGLFSRRP